MEETEERNGREKKCERKGKMEEEDREGGNKAGYTAIKNVW